MEIPKREAEESPARHGSSCRLHFPRRGLQRGEHVARSLVPPSSRGGEKTHSNSPAATQPDRGARCGHRPAISQAAERHSRPGRADRGRDVRQARCAASPTPAAPACSGRARGSSHPFPHSGRPHPGCAKRRGPLAPRTRAAGPCEGRVRGGSGGGRPRPAPKPRPGRPGGAGATTRAVTEP